MWCAIKAQKKIFQGQGISGSDFRLDFRGFQARRFLAMHNYTYLVEQPTYKLLSLLVCLLVFVSTHATFILMLTCSNSFTRQYSCYIPGASLEFSTGTVATESHLK